MTNFIFGIIIMSTIATIGVLIKDPEKKNRLSFLLGPFAWMVMLFLLIGVSIENHKIYKQEKGKMG